MIYYNIIIFCTVLYIGCYNRHARMVPDVTVPGVTVAVVYGL